MRADLDKGAAGCPIAVLSRRICAKACVKTRPTACPHSVCPAEKIRVRSGGGSDGANVILPPRRTYRFCAEVMFAYRIIIYVRRVVLSVCFFAAAEYIGVQRHAVRAKISCPKPPNIACAYFICSAAQGISEVQPRAARGKHITCVFSRFLSMLSTCCVSFRRHF